MKMKMKRIDTITTNKEADMSDCACEEEEELPPCLRFPFPFILDKSGETSGHN
jgi:hypothetical protein